MLAITKSVSSINLEKFAIFIKIKFNKHKPNRPKQNNISITKFTIHMLAQSYEAKQINLSKNKYQQSYENKKKSLTKISLRRTHFKSMHCTR